MGKPDMQERPFYEPEGTFGYTDAQLGQQSNPENPLESPSESR